MHGLPHGFDESTDLEVVPRRPQERHIIRNPSLYDLDAIAQWTMLTLALRRAVICS